MQDVVSQIERLKKIYNLKTDTALAERIGKDKNTVSVWKRRQSIPLEVLKRISDEENISMEWLVSGTGAMKKVTAGEALDTISMMEGLFSDDRSVRIVKLLRYAPKEFVDQIIERLEEFKRLSQL